MRNILFRPEHRKDSVFDAYTREKETFWKVNKEWRGKSEEEVARLWQEHVASDKQLQQLANPLAGMTGLPPATA